MITAADVQGHWVRHWIKAPGFEDHTTRVHWMQAGLAYADVRIPLDGPDLAGAACLADLGADALRLLAQAEGFAGHVTLEGDRCTWHREVNWHGTPDMLDVGAISFDDAGRMIEAGILAEYTELWEQHAQSETHAIRFGDDTYTGVLVTTRDTGVLGIGRPGRPPSKTLLDGGDVTGAFAMLSDGIHALCDLSEGRVTPTLATNPFAQGRPVLTISQGAVIWHKTDVDGTTIDVTLPLLPEPA